MIVQADLDKAEPALKAARENVANISKADLDFIRALAKPHANIVLAMKPVYYMCSKSFKGDVEWKDIKQFMMDNFIKKVQELNANDIPNNVKRKVLETFIHSPEWKIPDISNTSKAAGALASWAESQLSYADILTKVDPLKKEIEALEEEGLRLEKQAFELA